MLYLALHPVIQTLYLKKKSDKIIQVGEYHISVKKTSRKKTIALQIKTTGNIEVLTPYHCSQSYIRSIIQQKMPWIKERIQTIASHQRTKQIKNYHDGENLLFLGQNYALKLIEYKTAQLPVRLDGNLIQVYLPQGLSSNKSAPEVSETRIRFIQTKLTAWYREKAKAWLTERTRHFAEQLQLTPNKINIRTYKRRWGCCNSKKEITYNWQIIMAPQNIIDYLIIHELCHLLHHNHAKPFWECVQQAMPNYLEAKHWLRDHGHQLSLD